jgi:hypothetical protein
MRQGMLEVIPGMNVKVDAVITRSLNKAEVISEQVGIPGGDASPLTEQPAGDRERPLSTTQICLPSKKSLVQQGAQRDSS